MPITNLGGGFDGFSNFVSRYMVRTEGPQANRRHLGTGIQNSLRYRYKCRINPPVNQALGRAPTLHPEFLIAR